MFLNKVVECVKVTGRGRCACGKMPCFALAWANEVEMEGSRKVGLRGGTMCDGFRKEMREFISIRMVCITFRSHSGFEAQVATLSVWTFPRLRDCILLCNQGTIGNRGQKLWSSDLFSFPKESLTTPKAFLTDVCPAFC